MLTGQYPYKANGGRGIWGPAPVTSPLIDSCLDGPVDDLDGGGRPAGAGWEPGPFEVAALDQVALLIAEPTAGLVTTEGGGSAQFNVMLAKAPIATVDVPIASDDSTEGSVAQAQLSFTPENWDQAQTVIVTGVDDAVVDGDVAYSILLGPTQSADSAYDSLSTDVLATNSDDDVDPPTEELIFADGFE